MKLIILLFLFPNISLAMGKKLPGPSPTDNVYVVEGLQEEKQKQNQWCAAAAARLMMSSRTRNLPSQCDIVRKTTGKDCFNRPITTEAALRAYGYSARRLAPDFNYVVKSIKRGEPVTIYHLSGAGTEGQGGHAVVAYAAYNHAGRDYIQVYDPYYGRVMIWNSDYVTGNLQWYSIVILTK